MFSKLPHLSIAAAGALAANADPLTPDFDVLRMEFSQTGAMDLDHAEGDLSLSRFELRSFLSRPLSPANGWTLLPMAQYSLTTFDFDSATAPVPFRDEELHSLSLSAIVIQNGNGSPWVYGGWARAELASDFQHIDDDDFTFDVVAAVSYRFTDTFLLGAGAGVFNLNGDATFIPGITFDWVPNNQFRVSLYGPSLVATYTPHDDWSLSFRGESAGGIWNITDDDGHSRSIDLTSFRLGLYADRRLAGNLWLTLGGGAVVGNELDYTEADGDKIFERDPDPALFGMIGLRLRTW